MHELEKLSHILGQDNSIYDLVAQDLGIADHVIGAEDMNTEQILRTIIIKQVNGYSDDALAFHLEDFRSFGGCWIRYLRPGTFCACLISSQVIVHTERAVYLKK